MSHVASELRLVLFDCDGTLVDSQHHIVDAMSLAFTQIGLPPPEPALVRGVVGLSLEAAIAVLAPLATDGERDQLVHAYRTAFFDLRQKPDHDEPLFPGMRKLLDDLLAQECLLGVATGKSRRGLDATLALHGLEDLFTTLQTSDRARGKPDPHMVELVIAETGCDARNTVMIGDTTYDILMAVNAGVNAIGVTWGYHSVADLRAAGAGHIADEVGDLPGILQRIWNGN